jgi:hypothetical protein
VADHELWSGGLFGGATITTSTKTNNDNHNAFSVASIARTTPLGSWPPPPRQYSWYNDNDKYHHNFYFYATIGPFGDCGHLSRTDSHCLYCGYIFSTTLLATAHCIPQGRHYKETHGRLGYVLRREREKMNQKKTWNYTFLVHCNLSSTPQALAVVGIVVLGSHAVAFSFFLPNGTLFSTPHDSNSNAMWCIALLSEPPSSYTTMWGVCVTTRQNDGYTHTKLHPPTHIYHILQTQQRTQRLDLGV